MGGAAGSGGRLFSGIEGGELLSSGRNRGLRYKHIIIELFLCTHLYDIVSIFPTRPPPADPPPTTTCTPSGQRANPTTRPRDQLSLPEEESYVTCSDHMTSHLSQSASKYYSWASGAERLGVLKKKIASRDFPLFPFLWPHWLRSVYSRDLKGPITLPCWADMMDSTRDAMCPLPRPICDFFRPFSVNSITQPPNARWKSFYWLTVSDNSLRESPIL